MELKRSPSNSVFTKPETLNTDRFVVKEQFGSGSRSIGMNLDIIQAIIKQELKNQSSNPTKGMK